MLSVLFSMKGRINRALYIGYLIPIYVVFYFLVKVIASYIAYYEYTHFHTLLVIVLVIILILYFFINTINKPILCNLLTCL